MYINFVTKSVFGRAWAGVGAENVSNSIQSKVISIRSISFIVHEPRSKCGEFRNLLWSSVLVARMRYQQLIVFGDVLKLAKLLEAILLILA